MKLMVQSYNNGGSAYNDEAEETAFRSYSITHRLNRPAEAVITLGDPAGTIAQKYNVDANDVYVGPGKVTIEDPNETDVFFGRIIRAEADTSSRTVTLYARDFLDQLDEELVTIDMREDLDEGAGVLRQSTIRPYYDAGVADFCQPAQDDLVYGVADDGGVQTDESTETQDANANDMTLLPAVPAVNDAYYFGAYVPFNTISINTGTGGVHTLTITWEYYNGSWTALSDVSDGTQEFTIEGAQDVTFTMPTDWAETGVQGYHCYWIRARVSAYTAIVTQPLGTQATISVGSIIYDNDLTWTQDAFNGMNLMFADSMAGSITVKTGPYDYTSDASTVNSFDNDISDLWTEDTDKHSASDVGGNYYTLGKFKVWTPDSSSWYDSCTGARINVMVGYGSEVYVQLYNGATFDTIDTNIGTSGAETPKKTFEIPDNLLSGMFDSNGEVQVKFVEDDAGALNMHFLEIECDFVTTGYSTATAITDSVEHGIITATDFTADATKVWDGLPYSIAQAIYKHIATDELDRIIAGDNLETIIATATIEHTSGVSTRKYENRTRLEILQDLAKQDKAEFYMALGTATLTYKSTWGDNSNTITDATVDSWRMVQDWEAVYNEYDVYGMRIGDRQLYSNATDATSIAKYKATRTKVVRNAGLTSEYDTSTIATNRVAQDKDVQKILSATLAGFDSTYRLGTITEVTSSILGISAVDYIVIGWDYDSGRHLSQITLHPKVSTTGLQEAKSRLERMEQNATKTSRDQYIPEPATHEVD